MPDPKENILTSKQERFCYEYCIDFNATQAAIRSGYKPANAYAMGAENLRKPQIKKRIEELQSDLAKTAGISALRVINEHKKIAFTDAGQLRDGWIHLKDFHSLTDEQKASIQEISTKEVTRTTKDGDTFKEEHVKIKLYDKQKSLDSIIRMLGFDSPIKQELTGKGGKDLIPGIIVEVIDKREQVDCEDTDH